MAWVVYSTEPVQTGGVLTGDTSGKNTPAENVSAESAPAEDAPLDLGRALRALRRRADLSQRELAERAGVPPSTVARIESGASRNPGFRTVERLVAAGGRKLVVSACPSCGSAPGHPAAMAEAAATDSAATAEAAATDPAADPTSAATATAPAIADLIPHLDELLRDAAGRHYPAHLDVREVVEAKDWWGAWWAHWYDLPRRLWPREPPEYTYDLSRSQRDHRRARAALRRVAATLPIVSQPADGAPTNVWRWVVRDHTGVVIGRLGSYIRSRPTTGEDEVVVCDLEVAPTWRRLGLGSRLLDTLRQQMRTCGVQYGIVLTEEWIGPSGFLTAYGLRPGRRWETYRWSESGPALRPDQFVPEPERWPPS